MEHKNNKILQLSQLGIEERIKHISSDLWIGYEKADLILGTLEEMLLYSRSVRMANILIVGDTNNGKTSIVNRFTNLHLPKIDAETGMIYRPVLYVQSPTKPDEKLFYVNILDELRAPFRTNDRLETNQRQVLEILRRNQTKILIVDEVQQILAGNSTAQHNFRNVLKFLSNKLRICIVAVGVIEAYNALQVDPQLANRFEPMTLSKWNLDINFQRLLKSFEVLMPLQKTSDIAINKDIVTKIYTMSEGLIGEVSNIIKRAAIMAIKDNTEKITLETLSKINYTPPSKRRFKSFQ
jgi:GTPase SAR1 family protein